MTGNEVAVSRPDISRRTFPLPPWIAVTADSLAWLCSLMVLVASRYLLADQAQFVIWADVSLHIAITVIICVLLMILGGMAGGLYRQKYVVGTVDELKMLSLVAFCVWAVFAIIVFSTNILPRSVVFAVYPSALVLMCGTRLFYRLAAENRLGPASDALPVLLYGAGELGHSVVRQMALDPYSGFRPIGFLDDDPAKKRFVLNGVKVLGSGKDLSGIVQAKEVAAVVICVGHADSDFLREVHAQTDHLGIRMLVFPSINEALSQSRRTSALRDVSVDDLVGRHPAAIDLSTVAGYLSGKRVLVTGAGGSIGSELCRQIQKFGPSELMMLDRDESGLHTTQLAIFGHGLLDSSDVVLADIRDEVAIANVMTARRPEVVFHAAALKHLPMLEQYPEEAWKTNVLGTLNVLEASLCAGVSRFVNISTDKAAEPTSILGQSKRTAERLTAWASNRGTGTYVSVRFGNVLGSRGSMIPTFKAQIEAGGPVTVTHPDVTRYFMTVPEACELVVQAGAVGVGGEVMILEMGEPVRILDVARRMIDMSGKDIEIVFTGLRDGEKLHEVLFAAEEEVANLHHPRISHAPVEPVSPETLVYSSWLESGLSHH